ncbi:helix-turn-helix domain-containing protein [Nocardiopsis sp. HNM0947]|uniref:Helix-turn-helix domain-containing protein n=1 Tax=Nocardiopsis coralli TaxID=2772213 RepID=A0ABR9P2U5_9ACTN|nr:helix-turn-helix domain-containing protein [Nocardiopsis coralli]MBE2998165.1 helix-turn-helix domain-containing protein [Nocardiopsis coralli]
MHTVAVLALDDVVGFDLTTPVETFTRSRLPDGRPAYRVLVCSAREEVAAGPFRLRTEHGLEALAEADTVIVPGVENPAEPPSQDIVEALRAASARGARVASICSGAFVLAATGLLDGLRATTHWAGAALLAELHPEVAVDPDVLYVDNGAVLTSAGAAAGLDLCLHLVRRDHGSAVAAHTARMSVIPLEREGGQAQFIVPDRPAVPDGAALEPLLRWMEEHAEHDLTLDRIAARAGLSTRTLSRRFREQTGTTPMRWLHRARVRRAQYLLESGNHSVEHIAGLAGFGSPTAFRERFRAVVGTSPQAYRRAFRSG